MLDGTEPDEDGIDNSMKAVWWDADGGNILNSATETNLNTSTVTKV